MQVRSIAGERSLRHLVQSTITSCAAAFGLGSTARAAVSQQSPIPDGESRTAGFLPPAMQCQDQARQYVRNVRTRVESNIG